MFKLGEQVLCRTAQDIEGAPMRPGIVSGLYRNGFSVETTNPRGYPYRADYSLDNFRGWVTHLPKVLHDSLTTKEQL